MALETRGHEHSEVQAAPPKGKWRRRLTTGGWIRAAWVTPLALVWRRCSSSAAAPGSITTR